jgi:hypothetical protein
MSVEQREYVTISPIDRAQLTNEVIIRGKIQ